MSDYRGIITSLDVVAIHDKGVIFKEIIKANNILKVLEEIERNGLDSTKSLARQEFPSYYNRNDKLNINDK